MAKDIAIGLNDFKKIIEGNYAFADKTLFIKEFFINGAEVTLAPRPRRFGKTLNLSMLRYFCEKTEQSHRYLFDNLNIANHPDIMAHQGQYPVIFITLKDIKVPAWEKCYEHLQKIIGKEFYRHSYLLQSDTLSTFEKETFQAIIDQKASQVAYEVSLKNLSEYLFRYHQKRVIVLIDEYDTPIHAGYNQNYYADVVSFMRNLLCGCLKDNSNLHKGFLTGILRVAKESIFSGMNNLAVCSLTATGAAKNIAEGKTDNVLFTDKFGLLENEVIDLFKQVGIDCDIQHIREWYNGYSSGPFCVYNPWSIASYLTYREFKAYWINTSDNELIKTVTREASAQSKDDLATIFQGGIVEKEIEDDISFPYLFKSDEALWSFLLHSGYLSFTILKNSPSATKFGLRLPNKELTTFLPSMVQSWFQMSDSWHQMLTLLRYLTDGNITAFAKLFNDFVMQSVSYFDIKNKEPERFYHAFMLGMITGLITSHEIKSNKESGHGRFDLMLIPRDTVRPSIIIELKKLDPGSEDTLEQTATSALKQIEDMHYEAELKARGINLIKKVAIVFDGKGSFVKEG